MSTPFQVTVGTVPPGTCFTTPQALAQLFGSTLQINWTETDSLFNFGNITPSADKQNRPWIRTLPDGNFDRLYTFVNGQWQSPHYMNPGFSMTYVDPTTGMYTAAMSNQSFFDTLDGGQAGTVTPTTGPFWLLNNLGDEGGRIHISATTSGTYFPVGKLGPAANDPPGFQPNGPVNSTLAYVVVPQIYRSSRIYYTIPAA